MAVMASHAPSPQRYFAKFSSQSHLISVQRDSKGLCSMIRGSGHQIFSCVSGFPQSAIHNSVLERSWGLPWIIIRGIGGNPHLINSAKNRIEVTCSAGIELRWRAGAQENGYGEEEADGGNVELREKATTVRQRVEELRSRVRDHNNVDVSLEDLAALYDYPLDHFQQNAVMGFLEGLSLVVCAPTSSGKTLIAEVAAAATLARGKRLFYTTPLKALSNQKCRELQELFGEENVGILTGDAAVNRKAPIMVMTTEILRNMLYESVGITGVRGRLVDVDVVVLDEVHYLSDISRGTVWEETIIYCPKDVQLICLSATVANPEELASWITQVHGPTKLVTSSKRPVPLQWHFSTRQSLLPLLNEESTAMNPNLSVETKQDKGLHPFLDYFGEDFIKKEQSLSPRKSIGFKGKELKGDRQNESKLEGKQKKKSDDEILLLRRKQVPQIKHILLQIKERDMLPAIWFIFSRRGCDMAARCTEEVNLLSEVESRKLQESLQEFQQLYPNSTREISVKPLLHGVAAHHAGCLPIWKTFIEELFQKGLLKVVFSTETLAAGINMPARTAVLSSLSKRGDDGHSLLTSNAMLQMAGRAGRRGIDTQGHVVVVQTPFEGAEECCELLLAGPEPLVSQFTTSYGMVLNLLAGPSVTDAEEKSRVVSDTRTSQKGRTLNEARALIELSFGNFMGSKVVVSAQQHLIRLHKEIEKLKEESAPEALLNSLNKQSTKSELREFVSLSKRVLMAKQMIKTSEEQVQSMRVKIVKAILEQNSNRELPILFIEFVDPSTAQERVVPVLYVGTSTPPTFSDKQKLEKALTGKTILKSGTDTSPSLNLAGSESGLMSSYYVGLGSDNVWYMFLGQSVRSIHDSNSLQKLEHLGQENMGAFLKKKLQTDSPAWKEAGKTGFSLSVWSAGSSIDTWTWKGKVPLLEELAKGWEGSPDLVEAELLLKQQQTELSVLEKKLKSKAYRDYKLLVDIQQKQSLRMSKLQSRATELATQMKQLQSSGWKEFLKVVDILQTAGALEAEATSLLPLGRTAVAVRGVNELWLALAIRSDSIVLLTPSQLAAACGTLVSDGKKTSSRDSSSIKYSLSRGASNWVDKMEDLRAWLLRLQASHGVEIPAGLDKKYAGIVEAWASGVSWQELIENSGMDEGDIARLLRRSLDLLVQIPHLPHVHPGLERNARAAQDIGLIFPSLYGAKGVDYCLHPIKALAEDGIISTY